MFIVIAIALILAGIISESLFRTWDSRLYPAPGKVIEVDGGKLHIWAEGKGNPTLVFTLGSGSPSTFTDFSLVVPVLRELCRVCIYDRAGYGWSGQTSKIRSANQISRELHQLLELAGEKPPYILVGHSYGAMELLSFASKYPNEVAGVVLVDGGNPKCYANVPTVKLLIQAYIIRALRVLGLLRLLGQLGMISQMNQREALLPKELRAIDKSLFYKNIWNRTMLNEIRGLAGSARELESFGSIGHIPLIILTAEKSIKEQKIADWKTTQESLLNWSKNSKQTIVEGAGHFIQIERPDVLIRAIQVLIIRDKTIKR